MTRELNFGRKGAERGQAASLVVFLHGYGADGADLLGLADALGPHLPGAAFVAPDAPERCRNNPFGYQWFPIPWLDGSSEAAEGIEAAAADIDAFLDRMLAKEGLAPAALAVVGFSQGSMMALHVLPRREETVAGIVAFSGRLLAPERLTAETVSQPPVLLVHGDQDEMVPFAEMSRAGEALSEAGFETYAHVMRGMGHGISPDGLGVALAFLKDRLPLA